MAKNHEISYLMDFYGNVLTEKQRNVMEQYYNDDFSLAEIADNSGITRQGVRDSIKRGEGILLDLEEKVGYATYYKLMQESLIEMETLAQTIHFRNSEESVPDYKIADASGRLKKIISKLSE